MTVELVKRWLCPHGDSKPHRWIEVQWDGKDDGEPVTGKKVRLVPRFCDDGWEVAV